MQTVEYYGFLIEIDDYEDCHRMANQTNVVTGIPINPTLRVGFNDTPNELRHPDEISDWWGKPYIITTGVDDNADTWEDYVARSQQHGWQITLTQEKFEQDKAKTRQEFMDKFPEGTSYTVRCLDGGAHDRSTWCGEYATLARAIIAAKERANNHEHLHGVPPF